MPIFVWSNLTFLIMDNRKILVPISYYDLSNDNRPLIPFHECEKYGFMDGDGKVIVPPTYDTVSEPLYATGRYAQVGVVQTFATDTSTRWRYVYGIIDVNGRVVLNPEFSDIKISSDGKYFSVKVFPNEYSIIDTTGVMVIPSGKYSFIDGVQSGLSRVSATVNGKQKWGIINLNGEEVVPLIYDKIWNFWGHDRSDTTVILDDVKSRISLPICGNI